MSETKLTTKLKVKRNSTDTFSAIAAAQALDESKKLAFGEPMYVAKEDYLVVGGSDETQTIEDNGKVIRLLNKDIADNIGTKWLDGFAFNFTSSVYKKYKINDDGSLSDEETTTAPCGVKIMYNTTSGAESLKNIKSTMTPGLSMYVPAIYRNNTAVCKRFIKQFAFITASETVDGGIILYFSRKLPTDTLYLSLIGG